MQTMELSEPRLAAGHAPWQHGPMPPPIWIPETPLELCDHLGRREFFDLLALCLELAQCGEQGAQDILEQARASLLRAASHGMLAESMACARGLRDDLRTEGSQAFYEMALDIACREGLAALAIELLDPAHPAMELDAWIKRGQANALEAGQRDLAGALGAMGRSRSESAELRSFFSQAEQAERSGRAKSL